MSEFDDLGEDASLHDQLSAMTRQRDSLARQLNDVKHRHSDYLDTVWAAVTEAMTAISIPPVEVPSGITQRAGDEYAVALLSDLQMGKRDRKSVV